MPEQLPPSIRESQPAGPTGAPSGDAMIRAGRRARARRHGLTVGLAAAAVAAVAVGAVQLISAGHDHDASPPPVAGERGRSSRPLPANMRLLGIAAVSVDVPTSWTVNTAPCGTPDRPFVGFASVALRSCPRPGKAAVVSALGVGAAEAMNLAPDGWQAAVSDAGVRYEHTSVTCAGARCQQSYRLSGFDVAFALFVTASDHKLLRTLPASLAPLPAGRVAVPYFDPDTDFTHVDDLLESAGLHAVAGRTGAQPATPVSSTPAAGTVVPLGSKVTVLMDE